MIQNFDFFGQPEYPYIILTNPDKTELFSLGLSYDTSITKKFNALSEFTFKFPKSIDGGMTDVEAYDYLNNKRLVKIENYGYFLITNCQENSEGAVPVKDVSCQALESELIQKRVTAFGGTNKLWDIIDSTGTILQSMIDLVPNWIVGDIDTILLTKYRTFNVSDTNVYNFLMNDVSKAFECVFIFDTDTRTISAKAVITATTSSDIFLSFDNIIKRSSFSEKSDEIVTCLAVYGGGSLNIRPVNPLGTDKIYDFSYYKNTDWMSQSLVDAITIWENLVLSNQSAYSTELLSMRACNLELVTFNSDLTSLNTTYSLLETQKKVAIQTGASLTAINISLALTQVDINNKQTDIVNKQVQLDGIIQNLVDINTAVSFDLNFTPAQLLELDNFIYQNTYKDENIIQTDIMTDVEIQDAQQDLYNQSLGILDKVSQPRYEIEIESVNFISLAEFGTFTSQTELGTIITCEITPDVLIETVLLQVEMTFDNPENFSILLSNRVRKDGAGFVYSDLMGQVVKTGASVAFDNYKWSNWESNYKDEVSTFITSSLNTATNNLINNLNQEILINENGLRGRTYDGSTGLYNPTQIWLTSSVLAFSDDSFATSKLALGSVSTTAGIKFGLIAEVIYGRLLAGNTLTISNTRADGQPTNFVLDETGATLSNAKFTISNNNTKILLNPNDSDARVFRIQKNESTVWVDKFWVDNTGNVNFSGNLSAATGTFSGDISGSSGTFSGTVSASRILGAVSYTQLTDIPADKITSGTMSQSRVGAGYPAVNIGSGTMTSVNLNGGKGSIFTSGTGNMVVQGTVGVEINTGLSAILVSSSIYLSATSGGELVLGNNGSTMALTLGAGYLRWNGEDIATRNWVIANGGTTGRNSNYTVNELNGDSSWVIQNGVIKSITYTNLTRGVTTNVNPFTSNTGTWSFVNGRRTA